MKKSVNIKICEVQGVGAGLTRADQGAVVVQGAQVGPGQGEEGVQPGQVAAEAGPRQHRAHDDVPQGVADEAGGEPQHLHCGRSASIQSTWFIEPSATL